LQVSSIFQAEDKKDLSIKAQGNVGRAFLYCSERRAANPGAFSDLLQTQLPAKAGQLDVCTKFYQDFFSNLGSRVSVFGFIMLIPMNKSG
jgi:hypothetical protein